MLVPDEQRLDKVTMLGVGLDQVVTHRRLARPLSGKHACKLLGMCHCDCACAFHVHMPPIHLITSLACAVTEAGLVRLHLHLGSCVLRHVDAETVEAPRHAEVWTVPGHLSLVCHLPLKNTKQMLFSVEHVLLLMVVATWPERLHEV